MSKWSWRPGMRPRSALLIGLPLLLVTVFLLMTGALSLMYGFLDTTSPPLQVRGVITGFTSSPFDKLPHVVVRVQNAGTATTITPAVTDETRASAQVGDVVLLDYTPRLRTLYALEVRGQLYLLPGKSRAGYPPGSIALLIVGLLMLPFSIFLTLAGWHDLLQPARVLRGEVLELRATAQTRRLPGLTPRLGRVKYTMEVQPLDSQNASPVSFKLTEQQSQGLRDGQKIELRYSQRLHYVLNVKRVTVDS